MDGQDIKATLGKNIKILRARRGLSQADLAEKADMSITFLSTIERGIRFLQPDMMAKIANAEDISKNVNLAMTEVFKRYLG